MPHRPIHSPAECTPEEAFSIIGVSAIFASGSPFKDVDFGMCLLRILSFLSWGDLCILCKCVGGENPVYLLTLKKSLFSCCWFLSETTAANGNDECSE